MVYLSVLEAVQHLLSWRITVFGLSAAGIEHIAYMLMCWGTVVL